MIASEVKYWIENGRLKVHVDLKFPGQPRDDHGRFSSGGGGGGGGGGVASGAVERLRGQGLSDSQAEWAAGMVERLETMFSGAGRAAAVSEVVSAAKHPEYLRGILAETPDVGEIEAVVAWSARRGRMWE